MMNIEIKKLLQVECIRLASRQETTYQSHFFWRETFELYMHKLYMINVLQNHCKKVSTNQHHVICILNQPYLHFCPVNHCFRVLRIDLTRQARNALQTYVFLKEIVKPYLCCLVQSSITFMSHSFKKCAKNPCFQIGFLIFGRSS